MRIAKIEKIEHSSDRYDIQTETENFFANDILVHNSMVTPVWVDGELTFKTKKSFTTKEAALALEICRSTSHGHAWCMKMAELDLTPTFEITSPKMPIVLKYDKDELTLLHVRENVSGRYLTEDEINELCCPFPVVQNLMSEFMVDGAVNWTLMEEAAKTRTGIEGWIIQFENGDMVKLKTQWYCELHRVAVFLRIRDVVEIVLDDKFDDLLGVFAITGRDRETEIARQIQREVLSRVQSIQNAVEAHVDNGKTLERSPKDMALALREHELFGLIMTAFRDKTPDYAGWFKKQYLHTYPLDVLASMSE